MELISLLTWRAGVIQDCGINISYCRKSTSGQWNPLHNWPEEQVRVAELISSLPWRAGQNGGIDLFTALKSRSEWWNWSLHRSWVVELIPSLPWIAGQNHRIDSCDWPKEQVRAACDEIRKPWRTITELFRTSQQHPEVPNPLSLRKIRVF